jgi:hypothetical protein
MKLLYCVFALLLIAFAELFSQTYPLEWQGIPVNDWGGVTTFGVNKTHLYVATSNKGIYRASVTTQLWEEVFNDAKLKTINFMKVTDSRVYLHHLNYGINDQQFCYLTTNTGATWQKKAISANSTSFSPTNMLIYNDYLYFSSVLGYGTSDMDLSAISIKNVTEIESNKSYIIKDLIIAPNDTIYAISYGNGFFASVVNGETWKKPCKVEISKLYTCLYPDSNYVYLGTVDKGLVRYNTQTGELKSMVYNLGNLTITSITSIYGRLFISTASNGVYYFDTKTLKWVEVNNNLATLKITKMLDYKNVLYVLTDESKLFKATVPEPIPVITLESITKTQFCANETLKLHFTVTDYFFKSDNLYTVYMSDSSGSFSKLNPVASKSGRYSDSLIITLPDSLLFSKLYKFKVVASNPAISSNISKESITLTALPNPELSGSEDVCSKREYMYYSVRNPKNTLTWDIIGGQIISKNYDSALVVWNDGTNGSLRVTEFTQYLCSKNKSININIRNTPAKPIITKIGDTLFVSADAGIQWYFNSIELTGAKNKKLVIASNGSFKVKIDNFNGCPSDFSDSIYCTKTLPNSVDEIDNSNIISPNPASDYIEISYSPFFKGGQGVSLQTDQIGVIPAEAGIYFEIFNVFGEKESTPSSLRDATPQEGNSRIDISNLPVGVYFIKIGDKFEKFVKI